MTPTGPQPCIEVDEPMLDLGKRWTKEPPVKHSFRIRNTGQATLKVTGVMSSCGCTHTGQKRVEIEPGGTWNLDIELDLSGQQLLVAHKITVYSNDPTQPQLELRIIGIVRPPIVVEPRNGRFFGQVAADETRQRTLTLKNNTEEWMDLKVVRCDGQTFTAKLTTVTPGKEYKLVMTARPPYKPGANSGRIELATGLKIEPTRLIRPQAYLPPRLLATPKTLTLSDSLPQGAKRVVSVRNNGKTPVKVLRVTTLMPGVTTKINHLAERKVHNITVRFPPGFKISKGSGQLVIHTDDSESPEIKIGVFARPAARPLSSKPGGAKGEGK